MRKELYGVDMKYWTFRAHTLTKSTYARVVWYVQEDIEYMVVVNLWGNHNRVKKATAKKRHGIEAPIWQFTLTLSEKRKLVFYITHIGQSI